MLLPKTFLNADWGLAAWAYAKTQVTGIVRALLLFAVSYRIGPGNGPSRAFIVLCNGVRREADVDGQTGFSSM